MARRVVTVFLILGLLMLTFSSCDAKGLDELLSEGASNFAENRPIGTNSEMDNGELLDMLAKRFSDSYSTPSSQSLTEEEYIDLMRRIMDPDYDLVKPSSETTQTETAETSGEPSSSDVSDTMPTQEATDEPSETEQEPSDTGIPTVYNIDDLVLVFEKSYRAKEIEVEFQCEGGYDFNYSTDLDYIYEEIQRHDPNLLCYVEWFWTYDEGDGRYRVATEYRCSADEFYAMREETEALMQQAVSTIDYKNMSDYEIVYAVNQYLCDTVYYPEQEPYAPITHTPYGAFHDGCAVCEGYACAAKMMLSACGIESDIEVGVCIGGGGHAWNLVKVDGQWYQLDICWNDGGNTQMYFLVSDEFMKESRTWDENRYPACPDSYSMQQAA